MTALAQIVDYTTLKAAVAGMAHRSTATDITDNVPLFVQLFEAEAYDDLLLKDVESDEPLTLAVGNNYVALPTGFLSPIAFWLVISSQRYPLDEAMPQELPYDPNQGQPAWWAIDGPNVRFDCPANSAYSAFLRCRKKSSLSDSSPTNYLLLKRPDVYLWGCMKHMAVYMGDDAAIAKYGSMYQGAKTALQDAESRDQSMVPLRTDLPRGWPRPDIRRGY